MEKGVGVGNCAVLSVEECASAPETGYHAKLSGGFPMQDGRVLEVDPILAVEALPAIASPAGVLGARPVDSPLAADPLRLADARPFHIDLGHGAAIADDEPALEQGKRRG